MACKRITISLTEEQYDDFRRALPAKANISEVVADLIGMFVAAVRTYGDDFILDVMREGRGFAIRKKHDV
jgi:hypothetical protein